MAVGIDNVYQQVLAIANKEQRGYITPQEFNLFARKAQLDIFEDYFNRLDALLKVPGIGNNTVHGDDIDAIRGKIDRFEKFNQYITMEDGTSIGNLPSYYRMGRIYYSSAAKYLQINGAVNASAVITFDDTNITNGITDAWIGSSVVNHSSGQNLGHIISQAGSTITLNGNTTLNDDTYVTILPQRDATRFREIQLVPQNELAYYTGSDKLSPSTKFPICVKSNSTAQITIYPTTITHGVVCNYTFKPADPKWTYVVVNGKALYNASDSSKQDFSLHISEESTLVNKILELAGIALNKPGLSEVILRNEQMKEASKNQ